MKIKLILLFFILLVLSCQKRYEYIELRTKKSFFGESERVVKNSETIRAKNDSIAYMEAYLKFCINEKMFEDIEEVFDNPGIAKPISFKLIDKQGNDIALFINFDKIDSLKTALRSSVFKMENISKRIADKNRESEISEFKNSVRIDSQKIKELEPYFNARRDEFDTRGIVWHKPKSAPNYTNRNALYCYFYSIDGIPGNLRLRLQYHDDSWLFFNKVQFSIDGKAFEFIPMNTETDSGNGGRIWEWFDESMGNTNAELLNALANAKSAKMKLIGRQYHKIKTITQTQIDDIRRTLELYKAMGGNY